MIQRRFFNNLIRGLFCTGLSFSLILSLSGNCYADEFMDEREARKSLTVQSNLVENWPVGPSLGAESAILIEASTGTILYEKNIHEKMFPASTTKMMTCLLAMESEKSNLNDMVYFSYDAVHSIPWDGSNMGMDAGESMTLEDCLYGIMVLSANEVANAVGEYVSGDADSFVTLMNERAKELGCLDTHFNNAHGYTDPNHYTSAYDLALIAREYFKNEFLAKVSRTRTYHWLPTDTQPDDIWLSSKNYFLNGGYTLNGFLGSKTGFTDESRQVLVTGCERNGMRLIAVVMKEEPPYQYEDTIDLFNYGFSNFELVNVSEADSRYTIVNESFFHSDSDVYGDSSPFLSMDDDSTIVVPKTTSLEEISSSLEYIPDDPSTIAIVHYNYNGVALGNASIVISKQKEATFDFSKEEVPTTESTEASNEDDKPVYIYINTILKWIGIALGVVIFIALVKRIFSNFNFARRRHYIMRSHRDRKRRRKY